ncbi:Na+/H+ antiporter subunit E [Thermodesulfobacteriota bacterium]
MADREHENGSNKSYHPSNEHEFSAPPQQKRMGASFFLSFFLLMAVWLLLSGKFDLFHISLGIVSCLIVSYMSHDLLFTSQNLQRLPLFWLRFIGYIPWLLYQIFRANIHILYLVLHPRMLDLIDPQIIVFKSKLKSDLALVTFANSITLTPGTITVSVSVYGDFRVHTIDKASGEPLPGEMEACIARVFEE